MKTWVMISFPYSGYEKGGPREENFLSLLNTCYLADHECRPVIVLNRDTIERNQAAAFLDWFKSRTPDLDVLRVWSVDTCQMWLAGWGKILDEQSPTDDDRIASLPGDLDVIGDTGQFLQHRLPAFLLDRMYDITIGDFTSGVALSPKDLIDRYGTLPLLANWFPDVSRALLERNITKPRSEFVNIRCGPLRELLFQHRKFAYEQTLNFLIKSWNPEKKDWRHSVDRVDLGSIQDSKDTRDFRECLDQIERLERMLRLIWREADERAHLQGPGADLDFITRYTQLDHLSTAIRETAVITLRNLVADRSLVLAP